ncbi:UNVERIFIED_CONTAM: hypothetical protein K2H54_037156 [Gekko kuhli]
MERSRCQAGCRAARHLQPGRAWASEALPLALGRGCARRSALACERLRARLEDAALLAGWLLRTGKDTHPTLPTGAEKSLQLAQPSARQAEAVPFEEVWSRSYCAVRETQVDVLSEFPHLTEHAFKPPCVPLSRCTGCCGDDGLECAPAGTRPINLQVMQMNSILGTAEQVELTFTEHTECTCR